MSSRLWPKHFFEMLICFQACSRPIAFHQSEVFNPLQNQQTNRTVLGASVLAGSNEREVKLFQYFQSKVPAGADLSSHGPESLSVLLARWNH